MADEMTTSGAFFDMISSFGVMQDSILSAMTYMSAHYSSMNPADFMMMQFLMGELSQIGEAISNMLATINQINQNSIRNFKG